jgi:hypothetical protein
MARRSPGAVADTRSLSRGGREVCLSLQEALPLRGGKASERSKTHQQCAVRDTEVQGRLRKNVEAPTPVVTRTSSR